MAAYLPDFATLVEQVGPAVVNVSVRREGAPACANSRRGSDEGDDPCQEFFRRFGIPAT